MALTRRGFIGSLLAAGAAAAAFDPERLLWTPGQKTFFIPEQTVVEAKTLDDAVRKGLCAIFPDGSVLEAEIGEFGGFPKQLNHYAAVKAWIARVESEGGKVVSNRSFVRYDGTARAHA
jgi:hypothetical protein